MCIAIASLRQFCTNLDLKRRVVEFIYDPDQKGKWSFAKLVAFNTAHDERKCSKRSSQTQKCKNLSKWLHDTRASVVLTEEIKILCKLAGSRCQKFRPTEKKLDSFSEMAQKKYRGKRIFCNNELWIERFCKLGTTEENVTFCSFQIGL